MYARRALGWRCCHEASCCLLCCPVRHSASSEAFRGVSAASRRGGSTRSSRRTPRCSQPTPSTRSRSCSAVVSITPCKALSFLPGLRPCRLRVPVPRWTAVRIRRLACGRPVSRGLRPHIDMDALKLRCHSSRGLRPDTDVALCCRPRQPSAALALAERFAVQPRQDPERQRALHHRRTHRTQLVPGGLRSVLSRRGAARAGAVQRDGRAAAGGDASELELLAACRRPLECLVRHSKSLKT